MNVSSRSEWMHTKAVSQKKITKPSIVIFRGTNVCTHSGASTCSPSFVTPSLRFSNRTRLFFPIEMLKHLRIIRFFASIPFRHGHLLQPIIQQTVPKLGLPGFFCPREKEWLNFFNGLATSLLGGRLWMSAGAWVIRLR